MTVKLPAFPTVNVKPLLLVIVGGWSTVKVKLCVAAGTTPFVAVIVFSRALRYFGEAWLGVTLGRQSTGFLKAHAWEMAGFAFGLLAALYLFIWLATRRKSFTTPAARS